VNGIKLVNTEYWLQRFEKKKHSSDRITLNREVAIKYDFYSVTLVKGEDAWLFDRYENGIIFARKWSGDKYEEICEFTKNEFAADQFRIRHYYKASEFDYNTLSGLWWRDLKNRVMGSVNKHRISVSQYVFNLQKMQVRDRMEILQLLVDKKMAGDDEPMHSVTVIRKMFTDRFVFHPDKDAMTARTKYYLESLVESGDVMKVNFNYSATPRALITIESYLKANNQERHDKYIKNLTIWVTFMAFIFAVISTWGTLVQAEILPKWYGLNPDHHPEKQLILKQDKK
jgi:hypothetical protein